MHKARRTAAFLGLSCWTRAYEPAIPNLKPTHAHTHTQRHADNLNFIPVNRLVSDSWWSLVPLTTAGQRAKREAESGSACQIILHSVTETCPNITFPSLVVQLIRYEPNWAKSSRGHLWWLHLIRFEGICKSNPSEGFIKLMKTGNRSSCCNSHWRCDLIMW